MEYDLSKYNNPIVVIYGGTFSPFTMYNLKVAEEITKDLYHKNKGMRDIILYFIPTNNKYKTVTNNLSDKYIGGDSNKHRVNMLQIVCNYLNGKNKRIYFKISTNEIKEKKQLTTYESIIQIQKNIMNNKTIITNNDITFILIERHLKEILNGLWANPFSLLSKNIITLPSQHTHITINDFEKEINMSKMLLKETNLKNKEYLKLLSSNKKYLLSKIELFNHLPKNIIEFTPANTYDKLQQYYLGFLNMSDLKEYFIPKLLIYILKHKLFVKNKKFIKNKTIKNYK